MEDEEHEVYGGEIPDEAEMDGEMDAMSVADDDALKVSLFLSLYLFLSKAQTPNPFAFFFSLWNSCRNSVR